MNEPGARPPQRAFGAAAECDPRLCPDTDTLVAFADGTLTEAERDPVGVRIAECASCAAALRVALDAAPWADALAADLSPFLGVASPAGQVSAPSPDPPGPDTQNVVVADFRRRGPADRRFNRPPVALAIAASGMLVAFAAVLFMRTPPVEDVLRGAPMVAVTPLDGAVLGQAPASLRWPCAAAPAAASVEVLGADASPHWSAIAHDCAVVLPESTRAALAPGEYLWRVRNAAGEPVLGPFAFRVEP